MPFNLPRLYRIKWIGNDMLEDKYRIEFIDVAYLDLHFYSYFYNPPVIFFQRSLNLKNKNKFLCLIIIKEKYWYKPY